MVSPTATHPWEALLGVLGGARSGHVAEKLDSRDLKARPPGSAVTQHLTRLKLRCPRPLLSVWSDDQAQHAAVPFASIRRQRPEPGSPVPREDPRRDARSYGVTRGTRP